MTAELGPISPQASNGGEFLLPQIEGREPTLDEMRTDLATRCAEIPFFVWKRRHPSLQIVIDYDLMTSPLLPDDSHVVKGEKHTTGRDVVQVFLSRNGRLLEKLVHYDSHDDDAGKVFPDEHLGETSEERYRKYYSGAVMLLERLREEIPQEHIDFMKRLAEGSVEI